LGKIASVVLIVLVVPQTVRAATPARASASGRWGHRHSRTSEPAEPKGERLWWNRNAKSRHREDFRTAKSRRREDYESSESMQSTPDAGRRHIPGGGGDPSSWTFEVGRPLRTGPPFWWPVVWGAVRDRLSRTGPPFWWSQSSSTLRQTPYDHRGGIAEGPLL
jgi:hypothetical protein